MRKKVNKSVDKKIFKTTATRTRKMNVPGHAVPRGGIHL